MASTASLEGIKKAVFFPFLGEKWGVKVLIGSALTFGSFLIIPAIPVFGYFGQIMKRIIVQDEDPELPEWNDWGVLFLDGTKLLGATLIYLLPALILAIGGYALFMLLDLSLAFSASAVNPYSSNPPILPMLGSVFGMFGGLGVMMLGFVLAFVTLIVIPPALGNMLAKGNFEAAFRFKEWWSVFKANLSGYILAVALALGLSYLLYMLALILYATIVLCCLLPFALAFIAFIAGAVGFSVYAVAYRDGLRKLAQPGTQAAG
jgi:hypothetical protein